MDFYTVYCRDHEMPGLFRKFKFELWLKTERGPLKIWSNRMFGPALGGWKGYARRLRKWESRALGFMALVYGTKKK